MKFSHALAYTFGKKPKCQLEKTDSLITPGVGKYNPKNNGKLAPKWKFGKEIRVKKKDNGVPGPAYYKPKSNIVKETAPQYSFASKGGNTASVNSDGIYSPGPGAYNPVLRTSTPKYSMGKKYSFSYRNDTPGPGKYEIKRAITVNTIPSYKFSSTEKKGLEIESSIEVPGPGYYDVSDNILTKSQPMFSFGRELRTRLSFDSNPGPNQYNPKEYIGKEGPKISISKKLKPSKSENYFYPGPGQYKDIKFDKYLKKSPSFGMGKASRDDYYKKSDTPGPGSYIKDSSKTFDAVRSKTPSWVMGKEKKGSLYNDRDLTVPGVGRYELRKKPGVDGPKYTLGAKRIIHYKTSSNLGPGEYNNVDPKIKYKKSPSWKVGTGKRDNELRAVIREDFPGPGKYSPTLKNKLSSPQIKFGTGTRNGKYSEINPGPGSYHIPCSIVDVNDYIRSQGEFDPNYRYI